MSILTKNLACGYHGRPVVKSISITLEPGDGLALLGPNGSGKTTLMRTLIGLLDPISGTVEIHGVDRNEWPKRLAFVPQEEAITFPFTVRQVVTMGRLPHSPGFGDTAEDHRVVGEAMERADCADFADRPITELSGGEKQRAFIARALAQISSSEGPRILLLDEPSTHLDFKHQALLVRLIRELREDGVTVIAAWHDLHLSSASCNRALLLVGGETRFQGEMSELMSPDRLRDAFDVEFDLSAGPRIRV